MPPGSRVPASRLAALSSSPIAPLSAPPPPCHPGADDPLPDRAPSFSGLLREPGLAAEGLGLVRPLPGELGLVAPEMPVGGGGAVARPAEVEMVADRGR